MTAYTIYWVNTENLIGVVTSESEHSDNELLKLFCLHYPEYTEDLVERGTLFVGRAIKHVHSE